MQSAPSGMPPTSTAPSQQQSQHQQMAYEPQYYYAAPVQTGTQQMPTYVQQAANGQQYGQQGQFYPDSNGQQYMGGAAAQQQMVMPNQPYIYMPAPTQQTAPAANGMTQQPQIIYYPQPMGQMPAQAAPMYYQAMPTQMMGAPEQMGVMPSPMPMIASNLASQQQAPQAELNKATNSRGPLTSSTPLPTNMEYEAAQQGRNKNIQFRYHRAMEHDDDLLPIDDLSKITIDHANDDTMSAEKENLIEQKRGGRGNFNSGSQNLATIAQPTNYKTRLCMMHASGTKPCEMGSRCKFAHGLKELRTVEIPVRYPNNKYKTKLCKNFARGGTGFCPYGLRCEFVHPTDKEFQTIAIHQRMLLDERLFDPNATPENEDHTVSKHHRFQQMMSGRGSSTKHSSQPTKVLLKHRNVAGSMMCLSQAGRESNVAGGDFNSKSNTSQDNLPPHLRARNSRLGMNPQLSKYNRRVSLSQLKNKWTSEESLAHY